jgi:hypothetical protein
MPIGRYIPEEIPGDFWDVIEAADGDLDRLQEFLLEANRGQLSRFAWNYEEAAAHLRPLFDDRGLSEDSMSDLASWVVAQGRNYYQQVWDDPEVVSGEHNDPGFWGAAVMEYERRYGEPLSRNQGGFY